MNIIYFLLKIIFIKIQKLNFKKFKIFDVANKLEVKTS